MNELARHNQEIQRNVENWRRKPALRRVYRIFYEAIAAHVARLPGGRIVELGSGVGNLREVIADCVLTDVVPNPWLDQVENAYALSFAPESVSDLILFDVFHHLRYPGNALAEFLRVLKPRGRVILFEPALSLLGWLVYGLCHPEPVARRERIQWFAPAGWQPAHADYYAAQGNASRIFVRGEQASELRGWTVLEVRRMAALSYVGSGGYSGPQLYPTFAFGFLRWLDGLADRLPSVFATRLLVVLEKAG